MRIQSIHVRHFRSLYSTCMVHCGSLNVLIGKNNAGKSNLLATIDLAFRQLRSGTLAQEWKTARPADQFFGRDTTRTIQIGIEFQLPATMNQTLRRLLSGAYPQLAKSTEQLERADTLAIIVACAIDESTPFLFVQRMAAGHIDGGGGELQTNGVSLLSVPKSVGYELANIQRSATALRADLDVVGNIRANRGESDFAFRQVEEGPPRSFWFQRVMSQHKARPELTARLEAPFRASSSFEDFSAGLTQLATKLREEIALVEAKETAGAIATFGGETRVAPSYALSLMKAYGDTRTLHLREAKHPIGRPEADALLDLKVRRGGPERLSAIQKTIAGLLGVRVDAFEADRPEGRAGGRAAEMDIDEFLVEANGAGVREALRIILDLELQNPQIALIEEPEVHLHPGMERALEAYLRLKSQSVQMFITTHSTNFVDAATFQHVYLISRNEQLHTECNVLDPGDAAFRIPSELGLRLSSVFMYDQLVFVEGPSDEAVLRELARKLEVDIAATNTGFVHMGGSRNYTHYAAEHTLAVLTRRNIVARFVLDRDEAQDEDVRRMAELLGARGDLFVLERRELENYLLDPHAVATFVGQKRLAGRVDGGTPDDREVREALLQEASALQDEVVRLRVHKRLLNPVFLQKRDIRGTPTERLEAALATLKNRLNTFEDDQRAIRAEVKESWKARALELAPGTAILEKVCSRFGVAFRKDEGDSVKLAACVPAAVIPTDMRNFIIRVSENPR